MWFIGGLVFFAVLNLSAQNAIHLEERQTNSTCDCGISKYAKRIVGGYETLVNRYPWQIALIREDPVDGSAYQFCGGTIISKNYGFTAAHCFVSSGYKKEECVVTLGDHDLTTTSETKNVVRSISALTIHPQYNDKTHDNDIAIIKFSSPLTFTDTLRPACMPSATFDPTSKDVTTSGWGLTTEDGAGATKLREVQLKGISSTSCNTSYGGAITKNMICAGWVGGGKDSCQGDSGGPLVYKYTPAGTTTAKYACIGVVSFGYGCARNGYPGIYTKVSNYLSYINSNIGTDTTCPLVGMV